jgi:ribosome-associated protein
LESIELVEKIKQILDDKKAKDIIVINIMDLTAMADYFVICTGTSTTHIRALADEVEGRLEVESFRFKLRKEGYDSLRWVLLDYGDVILHIFHEEDREFYNLERLWEDNKLGLKKAK